MSTILSRCQNSMLRFLAVVFALVVLPLGPASYGAIDLEPTPLNSRYTLVVLEAEGCVYCQLFRRDVLPAYEASPRAREVPLRFVDINKVDPGLTLLEPVEQVPTIVLVKDQKELGRIAGYIGPEAFFHSVNRLLDGSN
jgi:Thioredoxin-related protein